MADGFLYETHLHTSEGSACARCSGADYKEHMISRGYRGMIVTDHFFNGNSCIDRNLPWDKRVRLYMQGYERALETAGADFDVLFGIEFNFEGDEYLIYGADEKWLLDNSDIMELTRREVYARVHQADAIMVQAHPFRERDYLADIKLCPQISDAIEAYNARNDDNMNALAFQYAKGLKLPMTAGSDIHYPYEGAMGGMLLPCRISSSAEYAALLMEGKAKPVMTCDGRISEIASERSLTIPSCKSSKPVLYM